MAAKRQDFLGAVARGKFRLVQSLLQAGTDVNERDVRHMTSLMYVAHLQREDVRSLIARLLLTHGADVNARDLTGKTALMYACATRDRVDVIRRIIGSDQCDVNLWDNAGNTALLHAALNDNAPAIRILLNSSFTKRQININQSNHVNDTPLSVAMRHVFVECARLLADDGRAEVDTEDDKFTLSMMLGCETSQLQVATTTTATTTTESSCNFQPISGVTVKIREPSTSMTSLQLDKISLHPRDGFESFSRHLYPEARVVARRVNSPDLTSVGDVSRMTPSPRSPRALLSPSEVNLGSPRTPIISVTDVTNSSCRQSQPHASLPLPAFLRSHQQRSSSSSSSYSCSRSAAAAAVRAAKPFQSPSKQRRLTPSPRRTTHTTSHSPLTAGQTLTPSGATSLTDVRRDVTAVTSPVGGGKPFPTLRFHTNTKGSLFK